MKVLVTGATGFLGSAVVRALLRRGRRVRVLVRRGRPARTLDGLRLEKAEGDVTNRGEVERALHGVDAVVHAAACVSFHPGDGEMIHRVNVEGTRNVLEAAAASGIRAIHTSSTCTVGLTSKPIVLDETATVDTALPLRIPYVASKIDAERLALGLAARGADIVVLNPGVLLGSGEVHPTSTSYLLKCLRAPLLFYPPGGASFGHVRDVAAAYAAALSRGRSGERYILAGVNVSYREVLQAVSQLSGQPRPLPLLEPVTSWWALASRFWASFGRHPFDELNPVSIASLARFNYCGHHKAAAVLGYRLSGLGAMLRDTIASFLAAGDLSPSTPELAALLRGRRRPRHAREPG